MPDVEKLSLEEIRLFKATLEAKEKQLVEKAKSQVIKEIREKVALYQISSDDIFGTGKVEKGKSAGKRSITHYNPATETKWTGRGPKPKEFKNMPLEALEKFRLETPMPAE